MNANPTNPSKGLVPAAIAAGLDATHRARLVHGWSGAGVVAIVIDRYDARTGRRREMMTIRPDANGDAWVEAVPGASDAYHAIARQTDGARVSFEALVAEVRS